MKRGSIVLLNGVTSAGKSALSKELQAAFDEPFYYVALDTFNEIIRPYGASKGKFTNPDIMNDAVSVMYCLIKDFSDKGLSVIVDHIMTDDSKWFNECVNILYKYPVMFVRVDCDRDVALERARGRGYTTPERLDQIDSQLSRLHKHNIYDLTISTSGDTIEKNAEIIKQELKNRDNWNAFKKLKKIIDKDYRKNERPHRI